MNDKEKIHELAEDRLARLTEVIDAMAGVMNDYQLPPGMVRTLRQCADVHVQSLRCHIQLAQLAQ